MRLDVEACDLPFMLTCALLMTSLHSEGPNGLFQQGCEDGSNTALGKDWANRVAPPNPNVDCRFPARPATLSQTDIDLLDVHIYEGDGSPAGLEANLVTEQWYVCPWC